MGSFQAAILSHSRAVKFFAEHRGNAGFSFRDLYVLPTNGGIPGYWIFSHGMLEDFLRTGDQSSRAAVALLSQEAAFARENTPLSSTVDSTMSREVAYVIIS